MTTTAADIQTPHDVEIINPDHVIATLSQGGKIDMQIKVEKGRGYVPGNVRRYGGLSAYLYVEMNHAGSLLGMKSGELGWTLEDNSAVNAGIRLMGGRIEKRYRIYEKQL